MGLVFFSIKSDLNLCEPEKLKVKRPFVSTMIINLCIITDFKIDLVLKKRA